MFSIKSANSVTENICNLNEFFVVNPILPDLAILCRFVVTKFKNKIWYLPPVGIEPRYYDSKSSMLPLP